MKKTLFATALAAAALAASPTLAETSGYLGFSASQTNVEVMGVEDDGNTITVESAIALPLNDAVFLQLNGNIQVVESDTMGGVTAHVGTRFANGLVAGFAGAANVDDEAAYSAGVEGQFYPADNATLAGTLGYVTIDDSDANVWVGNAEGRYFISDNFRVNANAGYISAEVMDEDGDAWIAGLGAEYQIGDTPLSFFGGYSHLDIDDADFTADTWTLGFRMNFSGSLKDRDRTGASLTGIEALTGGLPL